LVTVSSVNGAEYVVYDDTESINDATTWINTQGSGSHNIIINPGTYNKSTDRNNIITANDTNLTIIGNNTNGEVIINAQSSGRIFSITGNTNLTFINITFINGFTGGSNHGGAIYKTGNESLNIIDCRFYNNNASNGGAVYFAGCGDFNVYGSVFESNTAYNAFGGGGAICLYYTTTDDMNTGLAYYKVFNSNFTNNTCVFNGGGIWFQSPAYQKFIEIDFSRFINNSARYGGALSLNGGNFTDSSSIIVSNEKYNGIKVINSLFENNTASNGASGEGGAIEANDNTGIYIFNCTFTNNFAYRLGGAISNYYGSDFATIVKCTFINNIAQQGGGISNYWNDYVSIINCNFIDNTATVWGAGISNIWCYFTNIINCSFINNKCFNGTFYDNSQGQSNNIINSSFIANDNAIILNGLEDSIIGSNIINNTQGIFISSSAINTIINYNRIFNNTEYDLNNTGTDTDADYNWWGNNTPSNYEGCVLNNYFIMNVTNITSLDSTGDVTFRYTFELNNGDTADNYLLPYFVTEVYINVIIGVIDTFDARFDGIFDITLTTNGMVLYTFVADNEVQTLEGTIFKSSNDSESVDSVTYDNDNDSVNQDDDSVNQDDDSVSHDDDSVYHDSKRDTSTYLRYVNNTNDILVANASLKKTGIPINLILIILLSVLGVLITKKK